MYLQKEIVAWATSKGIIKANSFISQMKGVAEEAMESVEAYVYYGTHQGTKIELEKELGDVYIFWINACEIAGVTPEKAIAMSHAKNMLRSGSLNKDGRFVKDK